MRAAVIQMRSGIEPERNIADASALIRAAAADGAKLIATPEMTGLLQRRPKELWKVIKPQDEDPCIPAFSALAAELGITLQIGSLPVQVGERRAANRSFVFGSDGALITTYDKIHLFEAKLSRRETWREASNYDAGQQAIIADLGEHDGVALKMGLTICYDVRFSKLYRVYAQAGAQIVSVPAAFTVPTGQAHWEILLRARAIEASSFILAPAQGGLHEDGRTTYGHSMIIGPWGDVLAHLNHNEPGFVCADIDLSRIDSTRAKIPAWSQIPGFEKP